MLSALVLAALTATAAPTPPRIHVHAAPDAAFRANAYLIETDRGVIAVDAPFTVSEARAFRAELDALRKPLLGVLVTHAHPDHVNGITQLVAGTPNVPIYALAGVTRTLKEIDAPKRAYWGPIYKDEYPTRTTFPSKQVEDGAAVKLGGLTFRALDLQSGESADEAVWVLEGAQNLPGSGVAFVGDLVMNRMHAWLAEGRSAQWIASLDRAQPLLERARVVTIYPGHGEAGTLELLAWQKRYLDTYRAAVKELAHGQSTLEAPAKKSLEAKMDAFVPAAPLAMLVAMSADSVAKELAAQR